MHLRRNIFCVLSAAVMVALSACASSADPVPTLDWQPCRENAEFDCATIAVPVDWARPRGATIDVAVVREQAGDVERKVGTLVSLPGGPGSSGVDEILRGGKFSPQLRERFDIVSIDPRGVQRSHPVRCDSGLVASQPNMVPDAGGRIEEVRSYARDLADSCRTYTGPLIDHLDAASVARDVDALRAALGEDQLTLYSRSYGTMPAQAYAELFPKRLRASLMDSVDDHSLDGREFLASEARAGQDTFDEFAAWCAREEQCVLHGADVHQIYGELFAKAGRDELLFADKPLGSLELSQKVTQRLYAPEWSRLATDLKTLIDQPASSPVPPTLAQRSGEPTPMPQLAMCSDWRFDIEDQQDWLRLWHEQNTNAPTLRAHFAWGAGTLCSGWPIAPQNPQHHPDIRDGAPILVMNSLHDPATPHEWATQVVADTPRAALLTYAGWGHGVYNRTRCTTTAADEYFITLTLPAESSCAPS
ncbi:alpha/beta hydrolase [Nocardia australiensis]|uniref:alpha/beta hydrolase n=1 Tax=Nocardia australiensis TaxID=2887191 RepID=UPI001D149B74|nr:alpha/beta hydrolase [Nocardia australiensis]